MTQLQQGDASRRRRLRCLLGVREAGCGLEQLARVGVLGGSVELLDGPVLHDPAVEHDRGAVAGLGDHPEIVGDQDQGQTHPVTQ